MLSLISSYDTSMEQISVLKQLMEQYIIQDDEFHYGSVLLELGVALHGLGDRYLEEEKWVYYLNVCFGLVCGVLSYIYCTCKWLRIAKKYINLKHALAWSQSVTCGKGHSTSCFVRGTQRQFSEKYLFGRRFEIQNFRNIRCKISCLPASPRIFEHLKMVKLPIFNGFLP